MIVPRVTPKVTDSKFMWKENSFQVHTQKYLIDSKAFWSWNLNMGTLTIIISVVVVISGVVVTHVETVKVLVRHLFSEMLAFFQLGAKKLPSRNKIFYLWSATFNLMTKVACNYVFLNSLRVLPQISALHRHAHPDKTHKSLGPLFSKLSSEFRSWWTNIAFCIWY